MSFYLDIAAAVLVPAAALAAAIVISGVNDRRLVRQSLHLAERRIAILTRRKARAMDDALSAYLASPLGAVLADDPRINERRELILRVREAHASARARTSCSGDDVAPDAYLRKPGPRRRRRAEAALGLPPLFETA